MALFDRIDNLDDDIFEREVEKELEENGEKFLKAVIQGDLETVMIYCNNSDIHVENDEALKAASDRGYLEIVKFLIKNFRWKPESLEEALLLAGERERFRVVAYLILEGASQNHDFKKILLQSKSLRVLVDRLDH